MIANASKICHEGGRAVFIFWLTKDYLDSQDALANQIWAMKNFYGQHKFRSSQFGFVSTGTVQRSFEKFRRSRVEARSASIPLLATSTCRLSPIPAGVTRCLSCSAILAR